MKKKPVISAAGHELFNNLHTKLKKTYFYPRKGFNS